MPLTEERLQRIADERAAAALDNARRDGDRRQRVETDERDRSASQERAAVAAESERNDGRRRADAAGTTRDADRTRSERDATGRNDAETDALRRDTERITASARGDGRLKEAALLERLSRDGYVIEEARSKGDEATYAFDNGARLSFTRGEDGDIARSGRGEEQEPYFEEMAVRSVEDKGPALRSRLGRDPGIDEMADTMEAAGIKYFVRPTNSRNPDEREIVVERDESVVYKDEDGSWKRMERDAQSGATVSQKSPLQLIRDLMKQNRRQQSAAKSGRALVGLDIQEHDYKPNSHGINFTHHV